MSHLTQLAAVRQRARALRDSGDLPGAKLMLEQALEAARSAYGDDHQEVLATGHQLARLHREAGEPTAARRVLEEALAAGRLRYGDHDRLMLALSFDLGEVAEELGNRHEARRNFGRVAAAGPAVLGVDDWTVRAAMGYLAAAGPGAVSAPAAPGHQMAHAAPEPAEARRPAYPVTLPRRTPELRPTPERAPGRRGRGANPIATVAIAAAVAAVAATVVALAVSGNGARPGAKPAPDATTQPAPTDPPRQLRLREDRTAITLSWVDPTRGTAPFIVMGGRAGEQLRAMGTLNPGDTSYRLNGLNPTLDYCFAIVAVYATDRLAAGEQVCTKRRARPSTTH